MRLGCLPYLNVKPLVYPLEHGGLPQGWELAYAPPAQLAQMLVRGEIAAAPVSSYAAIAYGFDYVPGICIAADGPVKSVLVLSKKEANNIDTLALDTGSLSGANMARIILDEVYGCRPELVRIAPTPVERMLDNADAALVIGNPAMQCSKDGVILLDVAEEWKKLTGVPAVFALWAGNGITPELVEVLNEAKSVGMTKLPEIAGEESERLSLPYDLCLDYLSRIMIYDLGEREAAGLEAFRSKLAAHDLLRIETPASPECQACGMTTGGERIAPDEALALFAADLPELGQAADAVCQRMHPGRTRTYVIDRNINYTNICVSGCKFCAFYREPGAPDAYVLSNRQVLEKIREAVDLGATQIMLQGGLHPDLGLDYFEALFHEVKSEFNVQLHSLSAPEIVHLSGLSGLPVREVLMRLQDSGLDSLPGGGAEILTDRIRSRVSPGKCTAAEWASVMRAAASIGMRSTATMVFGMGEEPSDRVAHLDLVRQIQDETGVFTAFIPWTFQPGNTALGGRAVGGHDYLRTLAISRLYLDNIANIQASWVTQGGAIAQLALMFGANDVGSTMIEENVVAAAGVSHSMSESDLVELIRGAGFVPAQRDTMYRVLEVKS